MKRILKLWTLVLAGFAGIFFVGCESEPVDVPRPSVSLLSPSEYTIEPEEVFTISFSAAKGGESPLKAVTVYEDGTKVPTARMTINGVAAAANPLLVVGADVDGLSWMVDIVAQSSAATTVTYEVEVQDEQGSKRSVLVNVTAAGSPPVMTSSSPTAFSVAQDTKNAFRLTAAKGSGDLTSIEVRENDQLVDPTKIFWKEISMHVADNPFQLGDSDLEGFEEAELIIMTPATVGNFIYKITLTDAFGLTAELEFDVNTFRDVEMREDVLLNAGGGQGTGGLDLDTGLSTNSDDPDAEIKDNGIDLNLPVENNWLRTISAANDAQVRYLRAGENGLSESFSFLDVQFKEDLPALFDNGVEFSGGASEVVQVEDVFIVTRDGKFWLLEVIQVVTDPNNNEDSYTFDIKY